jgi:hypothetical protein
LVSPGYETDDIVGDMTKQASQIIDGGRNAIAKPARQALPDMGKGVLSRCWHVRGNAATIAGMKRATLQQSEPANDAISYSGYRFPPDAFALLR